jgi:uncharacterized protein YjbJ (UPF0337 family)
MNQITWQGKLRQMRGELKREWGKFTHNDRRRFEGELDRMLGQMQQQYGYTRERALNELERYWQDYAKVGQAAVAATLGLQRRKSHARKLPWFGLIVGIVTVLFVVTKLRRPNHSAPARTSSQKKRDEAIRQERERDRVDEQSWESFPASDPPASW